METQEKNLTVEISQENSLWIQECCAALQSSPTPFLNSLLNLLKAEHGLIAQNLPAWMEKNRETKKNLAETLQKVEETRLLVEETTRATRLYLQQAHKEIQKNPRQ